MTVRDYICTYNPSKVHLESSDVDISTLSKYSQLKLEVIEAIRSDTDHSVKLIVK